MAMSNEAKADYILTALEAYYGECDRLRQQASHRLYGHPGAFVHSEAHTREGAIEAMSQAMRDLDDLT